MLVGVPDSGTLGIPDPAQSPGHKEEGGAQTERRALSGISVVNPLPPHHFGLQPMTIQEGGPKCLREVGPKCLREVGARMGEGLPGSCSLGEHSPTGRQGPPHGRMFTKNIHICKRFQKSIFQEESLEFKTKLIWKYANTVCDQPQASPSAFSVSRLLPRTLPAFQWLEGPSSLALRWGTGRQSPVCGLGVWQALHTCPSTLLPEQPSDPSGP